MKNKMIGLVMLVVLAVVTLIKVNLGVNSSRELMWSNVEALANDGENVGCPNGGYNSTGRRTESIETWWEKFDIKLGISIGLFKDKEGGAEAGISWNRVMTVAYFCDQSNNKPCVVCNRYKL